jgi:hypothetical protein
MEWRSPSSPRYNKFWFQKSKNKVLLVTFINSQGILHKELVPQGSDDEYGIICGNIISLGPKNLSDETSVSGERNLVPLT